MRKRFRAIAFVVVLLAIGALTYSSLPRPIARAQTAENQPLSPIVRQAEDFYVTPPVRDLPPDQTEKDTGQVNAGGTERPIRVIPNQQISRSVLDMGEKDGALIEPETTLRAMTIEAPTPAGANFEGLSSDDNNAVFGFRVLPPDTIGDVGPTQYVQAVNLLWRVFDKTGTPLTPARKLSSLFRPGSACGSTDSGDPTVNYDALADRWVITQFALPNGTSGPFYQCIAVSQTGDATGAYYAYQFLVSQNVLNDYPKFGVWPDAYYMTTNEFRTNPPPTTFVGAGFYAFDRRKMLAGDPTATYIYFSSAALFPGQVISGVLPSTLDNATAPPPPGRPNTFAYFTANEYGDPQGDALRLFDFRVDFNNPSASTFTERPDSPIAVAAFNPLNPSGRNDIEQPPPAATTNYLDSIGDRLMHRLQYRNFGTPSAPIEALVVSHTVNVGTGTTVATHQAAPRYYELRNTGSGFAVLNQGTFVPDGIDPTATTAANRWMSSVSLDNDGNLALGYSVSNRGNSNDPSTFIFPSIRVTGRLAGDPPNALQPEASLINGGGVQTSTSGRWGDYSSMNVDPVDDCTFWYTQEYYASTSSAGWRTRVGSFRFPSCTPPSKGRLRLLITECNSGQLVQGAAVTIDGSLYGTTLANGAFEAQLAPGTHTVVITPPAGYTPSSITRTVTISDGATTTLNECFTGVPVLAAGGATLINESCPPTNGAVDPGERVTLNLALRNVGTASTSNLVATLLPSPNVIAPSDPQNYGTIAPGGSAARDFTFTAAGDCGNQITLTLQLQDGSTNLGTVTFSVTLGALQPNPPVTFSNTTTIVIPDSGAASPYPSSINVAGLTGRVRTISVTLFNFNHTFPDDVDVLLVSPTGRKMIILSDAGGSPDAVNSTIILNDGAGSLVPDSGPIPINTTTSYKPTNYGTGDTFPTPAPGPPYESPATAGTATFASVFGGDNPNGTWSLYVVDDAGGDSGNIAGGWSIEITTEEFVCAPACGGVRLETKSALSRDGSGNVVAQITITNAGNVTANNVTLNTARLASINGVPLPQTYGNLAPGQSVTRTVTFPGSSGLTGTVLLRTSGTYDGGSFGGTRRATLP